jgi:hypothetical protein
MKSHAEIPESVKWARKHWSKKKPTSYRKDYLAVLDDLESHVSIGFLIEWIADPKRKEAVVSFTSGPSRQLAVAVESAIARSLAHMSFPVVPPLVMRPRERCPRCGFTRYFDGVKP